MGCVYGMPLRKRRDSPKGKGFVKHSSKRWVIPDHEPERSPMRHDKQRSRRQSNSARHLLFADDGEKQRPQHCQQQDRHQSFKHDHRGDQPDEAYHDHDHDHHLQKGYVHTHVLNPRNPPKHIEGEQIAAGWPFWLTSVAAEAIKDWIPRRADSFEKIRKIGQGTYSNVYKARDLDTGKIVALKKVRFDNLEPESVRFMAREIQVLRCLDHPNVVKLEGLVTSRISCNLYLVFEYMEHDLAGLCAAPAIKFTESQVKCYMQQLLRGLDHCHSCGVLHRDIKGSNLLIDNSGVLKIADFGLATFFHPEQRQPLTSRVVTLWYRAPELLLGATEYDTAVDLWSAGCILAELLAGEPIMPGRTEVEQLHKIFKLCGSPSEDYWERSKLPHATIFKPQQPYKRRVLETFKDFPVSALALLEVLLAVEPANRGTAASALKSEYLNTNPLPCDPSSLPHYPPCKELDTKVQNDKARRRHRAGGVKAYHDGASRAPKKSKAIPACDANAELACSNQKSCFMAQGSSKRKSQKFNVHLEDGAVGFHIDPPRVICLPTETSGNMQMPFQQLGPSYSGIFPANVSNPACNNTRNHDFLLSHTHSSISSKIPTVELKKQGVDGSITGGHVAMPCTPVSKSHIGADMHKEKATGENNSIDNLQENSNHRSPETDGHSAKHGWPCFQHCDSFHGIDNYHLQCQPVTCYKSNEGIACEEAAMAWLHDDMQGDRIHCSGPLLPPSGNTDEFLKEHEYRIQNAVRRAQQDKGRCQKIPPPQSNRKTMEQQGPVSLSNTNVPYSDDGGKLPSFTSSSMLKPTEVRLTEEVCEMKGCKRSPS